MVKADKLLGERVKELRLSRQLTQVEATTFFHVSLATLCRIEAGLGCGDLVRAKIEKVLAQFSVTA